MPNFISWPCPSCGEALEVAEEASRVMCGACGNEHSVHRERGIFSLKPIRKKARKIETGFDEKTSEDALASLKKEIKKKPNEAGKHSSIKAVNMSPEAHVRLMKISEWIFPFLWIPILALCGLLTLNVSGFNPMIFLLLTVLAVVIFYSIRGRLHVRCPASGCDGLMEFSIEQVSSFKAHLYYCCQKCGKDYFTDIFHLPKRGGGHAG